MQAALAGQGVTLGRLSLIGNLLADGQLVTTTRRQPFATEHWYRPIQRSGGDNPVLTEM